MEPKVDKQEEVTRIIPGIYRHYTGKMYLALGVVVWHDGFGEGKPRLFVCYVCLYPNNTMTSKAEQSIRPISEWVSKAKDADGATVDRYTLITPLGP